jgi:hypothetical protein
LLSSGLHRSLASLRGRNRQVERLWYEGRLDMCAVIETTEMTGGRYYICYAIPNYPISRFRSKNSLIVYSFESKASRYSTLIPGSDSRIREVPNFWLTKFSYSVQPLTPLLLSTTTPQRISWPQRWSQRLPTHEYLVWLSRSMQ